MNGSFTVQNFMFNCLSSFILPFIKVWKTIAMILTYNNGKINDLTNCFDISPERVFNILCIYLNASRLTAWRHMEMANFCVISCN